MKCYGQEFRLEYDNFPCPTKAQTWDSLEECIEAYEEFLVECERNDQEAATFWVYLGKPDGDEEVYGYPDYPDYFLAQREDNPTEVAIIGA